MCRMVGLPCGHWHVGIGVEGECGVSADKVNKQSEYSEIIGHLSMHRTKDMALTCHGCCTALSWLTIFCMWVVLNAVPIMIAVRHARLAYICISFGRMTAGASREDFTLAVLVMPDMLAFIGEFASASATVVVVARCNGWFFSINLATSTPPPPPPLVQPLSPRYASAPSRLSVRAARAVGR